MKKEEAKYIEKGDKLKVKALGYLPIQIEDKNTGHKRYLHVGDILTVFKKESVGVGYRFFFEEDIDKRKGAYLTASQVESFNDTNTIDNINNSMIKIEKLIERLYEQQRILKQKILFIEETGCKIIDEVEFKSWMVLNAIEHNPAMTKKEKTKLISELIKLK